MFTPVICVFVKAGGQFDSENDPEEIIFTVKTVHSS